MAPEDQIPGTPLQPCSFGSTQGTVYRRAKPQSRRGGSRFRVAAIISPNSARLAALLALLVGATLAGRASTYSTAAHAAAGPQAFVTSIDTMKESMDTDTWQISDAQIADDVAMSAQVNPTYITVDTHWDYPAYMQRWVNAVRATGRHVWFRIHPNQWEDSNGATGIMTPAAYESAESAFILGNPGLFKPGDILDPCPEPENGLYWQATYGPNWSWPGSNAATREFNAFIRDTTTVADSALQQLGISGVITTVRSTNSWWATHPDALEQATVNMMGRVTVDSYPDADTTDPATAANLRVQELASIYATWHVPIIIGEMGYSNNINVDDSTQASVLKAEFAAISGLPYIEGVNYWVGAGGAGYGGYTNLFRGSAGAWTMRQAAAEVAAYFSAHSGVAPAPSTATPTPNSTATYAPSATRTATPPPSLPTSMPRPSATPTLPASPKRGGAFGHSVPPASTATQPPAATATSSPTPTATSSPTATIVPSATATPSPTTAPAIAPAPAAGTCVAGWSCADIGAPAVPGSQSLAGGTWTLQGAGWDIWYTSGQFHYVWQSLPGDGSFSALLLSQTASEPWAKAGLMVCSSTDPQAPHYALFVTPGNGVLVQYRTAFGTNAVAAASVPGTAPLYLKIARAGATFTAYTSADGTTWVPVPGSTQTLQVSGPLLAGLAVTSHASSELSTASFSSVTLQQG